MRKCTIVNLLLIFDKVWLSMDGNIGGDVFSCQEVLCIEKQGLTIGLGKREIIFIRKHQLFMAHADY